MAQGTLLVEVYRYGNLTPIANAEVRVTSEETGAVRELTTDTNGRTRLISLPAPPRAASLTPDSGQPPFYRYTVTARAAGFVPVRITGVQLFPSIESIVPVHMIPRESTAVEPVFAQLQEQEHNSGFFQGRTNDADDIAEYPVTGGAGVDMGGDYPITDGPGGEPYNEAPIPEGPHVGDENPATEEPDVDETPPEADGSHGDAHLENGEVVIDIPESAVMEEDIRKQIGPPDYAEKAIRAITTAIENTARTFGLAAEMPADGAQQGIPLSEIDIPDSAVMEDISRRQPGPEENGEEDHDDLFFNTPQPRVQIFHEDDGAIPVFEFEQGLRLRTVFIPETITVHLGRPSSDARNITVSFLDYIKNVASSEIFPTWPENALRANIHAQVGFTLNRVYTEWYRSQGYDFDITNTTAYDQAFVEGRNIFENISLLVDEIFNLYPRRQGRVNPLFSSYCNGTTSTCAGLSQWGTVTLAERGYTPLQMLQYYYGNDVELAVCNDIRSNTGSYPGYVLERGSQGEPVRILQRQLLRIRNNFPYIPEISSTTGVFGANTEAAVRAFQEIFDLRVDGRVGPATWYEIARIYNAVTGLGELGGEGLPLPGAVAPYPGYPLLQGSRGEDVRALQRYLNDLASAYGPLRTVSVDGIFGSSTTRAVIAFQELFGLTPDGVVGADTWDMLMLVWDNAFQ